MCVCVCVIDTYICVCVCVCTSHTHTHTHTNTHMKFLLRVLKCLFEGGHFFSSLFYRHTILPRLFNDKKYKKIFVI